MRKEWGENETGGENGREIKIGTLVAGLYVLIQCATIFNMWNIGGIKDLEEKSSVLDILILRCR